MCLAKVCWANSILRSKQLEKHHRPLSYDMMCDSEKQFLTEVFLPVYTIVDCRMLPLLLQNYSEPPKRGQTTGAARKLSKSVENIFDTF